MRGGLERASALFRSEIQGEGQSSLCAKLRSKPANEPDVPMQRLVLRLFAKIAYFSSILGSMPGDKKKEGPRLLVVDYDEGVREAMVDILQMMGYCVASATNGKEALDYLRAAATPDLIISD